MTKQTSAEEPKIFVGQSIVADISEVKEVDLVSVLYENGNSEDFTAEQWEAVKSDKPYSDGEISIRKFTGLMQRIIKEMVEARVTLKDHSFILERIGESIGMNYRQAIAKQFNKNKPEDIELFAIDAILKQ